MPARELFVWYRVRREDADRARAAVDALQRSLRREWPGLEARLLVRDEGATSTWMETYTRPAGGGSPGPGIDDAIEAAIAASARPLESIGATPRHVEAFDAVA